MIFIVLASVFTTLLFTSFKYFDKLRINTLHAIIVNYFIAAITSYLFADKTFSIDATQPWFRFAAISGLLFILTFVATSIAAQKVSLVISMITSKMSLVIPLTYAVLFLGEEMNFVKVIAIVLAMIGVVLTILRVNNKKEVAPLHTKAITLIAVVFAGSGLVDTSFKYIETNYYAVVPLQYVMMVCYFSAGVFGILYLFFNKKNTSTQFSGRSVVGGLFLGVLNYFSFYFVLEALHASSMPSTVVFPIVNVSVLLLSTMVAILLFHERLRTINYIGVVISILSILILAFQNYVV